MTVTPQLNSERPERVSPRKKAIERLGPGSPAASVITWATYFLCDLNSFSVNSDDTGRQPLTKLLKGFY